MHFNTIQFISLFYSETVDIWKPCFTIKSTDNKFSLLLYLIVLYVAVSFCNALIRCLVYRTTRLEGGGGGGPKWEFLWIILVATRKKEVSTAIERELSHLEHFLKGFTPVYTHQ